MSSSDVVIVDAVRTPIGKRNGAMSTLHPAESLARVQRDGEAFLPRDAHWTVDGHVSVARAVSEGLIVMGGATRNARGGWPGRPAAAE